MSFVAIGSSSVGKRELEEKGSFVFDWHCCNHVADVQRLALQRPHDPYCTGKSPLMNLLLPKPEPYPWGTLWALLDPQPHSSFIWPSVLSSDLGQKCSSHGPHPVEEPTVTPFYPKLCTWVRNHQLHEDIPTWCSSSILGNEIPEFLAWMASNAFQSLCRTLFSRFSWASVQVHTSQDPRSGQEVLGMWMELVCMLGEEFQVGSEGRLGGASSHCALHSGVNARMVMILSLNPASQVMTEAYLSR